MIDLCQPCKERGKFRVPSFKWKGVDVCGDCYRELEQKNGKPVPKTEFDIIVDNNRAFMARVTKHEDPPMQKAQVETPKPKCICAPDCPKDARPGKNFAWGHRAKKPVSAAVTETRAAVAAERNGVPGNEHSLKNPALANAVKVLENQRAGLLERVAKLDEVIATIIEID